MARARTIDSTRIATVFTSFDVADASAAGYGIVGDVVYNPVGERLNSAAWSTGDATLIGNGEMFTSSVQSASSGEYYLDVYRENPDTNTDAEPQFAIAHGIQNGSGSTGLEGASLGKTYGAATYGQFASLLEDKGDADNTFTINGAASTSSIFIKVYRNRMRERLDAGNWELILAGTGGQQLKLIDEKVNSASADMGDGPFSVRSGSIADGLFGSVTTEFGKFYPNYGTIVLDSGLVHAQAPINGLAQTKLSYDGVGGSSTDTGKTNKNIDGTWRLVSGSGGAQGSFQARATEQIHSRTYFCRIPNYKYNYSSNPTFTTGSNGRMRHDTMVGNPSVYITTVGLYDDSNELVAVARLSKPLLKSFEREALIRVRLEY